MKTTMNTRSIIMTGLLMALPDCWARTTAGPSSRPPDAFRGAADATPPADPTSLADLKWFEVFKDERLQELIRTALVENYDLRDAVVRVDAARANLGITRADQFPTVAAGAT